MKQLVVILLVFGLAFAGSFPAQTGMLELLESTGTTDNGVAYYSSEDEITVAIINAEPFSSSEWNEIEGQYVSYGLETTTYGVWDYYYVCEQSGDEMQCFIDTYGNGVYYTIDVSVIGGTKSESLNTGIQLHQSSVSGADTGVSFCSAGFILALLGLAVFLKN